MRSRLGIIVLLLAATGLVLLAACAQEGGLSDQPEGCGASARGGEGGRVVTVTTLADAGPGSLREALSLAEPRIIRFAVGGTIDLLTRPRVTHGRVTLDGSDAPGGITIRNQGLDFVGDCDDLILRQLRIRVLTGGAEGDCLTFWGNKGGTVERVLIDHCSLLWATDEVVNTWGEVRDVTCQWTIIAKAQMPHSKAWLSGVGSDRVTIHHCLLAHNADRNPKLEGGVYDVVNNVIYNWSNNNAAKIQTGARVNFVNNCFLAGPQSAGQKGCVFVDNADQGTRVYLDGNVTPLSTQPGDDNQWRNVTWNEQAGGRLVEHRPAPPVYRASAPFPTAKVTTSSALDAYEQVLARAGTSIRDADDLQVIADVKARTGHVGR
jgi:pectate lyase